MKKGFTLIELLVVVTIIAIISGFAISNVRTAKQKARDAVRATDMKSLSSMLGLYQVNKGLYPIYDGYITGSDIMSQALLNENVAKVIPIDPLNQETGGIIYKYSYQSLDGSTYVIGVCMETATILDYVQGCGTGNENKIRP